MFGKMNRLATEIFSGGGRLSQKILSCGVLVILVKASAKGDFALK